ncbi:MAG: hypothetical protein AB3N07_10935 [Ruegeria sp.]
MSLKYHPINNHNEPSEQFGSIPVFHPNNDNIPPREMLRNHPIVATHWYGLKLEVQS